MLQKPSTYSSKGFLRLKDKLTESPDKSPLKSGIETRQLLFVQWAYWQLCFAKGSLPFSVRMLLSVWNGAAYPR